MVAVQIPGITLHTSSRALHLESKRPLRSLSSSVVGGGFSIIHHILNLHVDKNYRNPDPAADIDSYAKKIGLEEAYLGMMTAVFLNQHRGVNLTRGGLTLSAVVTAGVGNACAAGRSEPLTAAPRPGTINIILLFSHPLSPAALVNAVITATEVKTDVLRRMAVRTPEGIPATGTSTDAIAVACPQQGAVYPYAGPLTTPGWLIGQAVRKTLLPQLKGNHRP